MTRGRRGLGPGLLVLVACREEPPPTADAVEALSRALEEDTPAAALAACAATGDLARDCYLEAVRRYRLADPESCLRIDGEPWRDECFFLVAEAAVAAPGADAEGICEGAGAFWEQCAGHVTNARFRAVTADCPHPVDCLVRDRPLVGATAQALGVPVDKAWADYFTQALRGRASLSPCERAGTADLVALCRRATLDHVQREVAGWATGPRATTSQHHRWCVEHEVSAEDLAAWVEPGEPALQRAATDAVRYACLPPSAQARLALGWNTRPQGDPVACEALAFPPERRTCLDALRAGTYQRAGEACLAAEAHPVACVEAARAAVEAAAGGEAADTAREWRAWYFQHLWRHLPLSLAPCAAATGADRATCEDAVREATTRLTTYAVAGSDVPARPRQALWDGGPPAVQDALGLVADPAHEEAVLTGLSYGCPADARPRDWPWEPGFGG